MSEANAVLNPYVHSDRFFAKRGRAGVIKPRATEPVLVTSIKDGDTIVDHNTHNQSVYRVVKKAEQSTSGSGWMLYFDVDRDVPVPPEWFVTISHGGRGYHLTDMVERVTDLGDFEMTDVDRLRYLDKLIDGRGVWEVADQASQDGQVLVRYERSDNFTKMPLGTVVLVEGRRISPYVVAEMERSEKRRFGR